MRYHINFFVYAKCSAWLASVAFAFFSTLPASAHPGHEPGAYGVGHVVTSPYHLMVLALIGTSICIGARLVKDTRLRRLTRIAGTATIVSAALLWLTA